MEGHLFLKGFCLQIVLTLAVTITAVMGYSSGAPDFVCSTMTPGHSSNTASGPVPFSVNISSLSHGYQPGQTYTIVLSGSSSNADFRGFLIQGRTMANAATGTFMDNGDDQQLRCSNSAVTHMNGNDKTMVELRWTAPPMGTGTISFRYAFVDIQTRFWPDQATSTVIEATTSTTVLVMFSQSTYTVNENDGPAQPVLVLSSSLSTSITVQVSTTDVTANGGGIDYNSGLYNVTIPAGITRVIFNVTIINDTLLEDNEEFMLFINNGSLPDNVITNSSGRATVIIRNDDVPVVEFTSEQFSGSESSGFIEVAVRITGGTSSSPITVTVTPFVQSPVSAMGSGIDFNSNPFNITINAGATEGRANISVTCDDEVEGSEIFNMTLTLTSNVSGITLGRRNTSEGVITDSTVEVSFNQSSYGVMEDDGTITLMITLSQQSSVPFQVTVNTTNVTAVDGEDYSGGSMIVVNVSAGVKTQSFALAIGDNDIVECNETFIVTILSVNTCGVTIGHNNRSEVIITDDDSVTVSLSQSQYSVAESDTSLTVNITLSSRASEDVMVEVTISNGSANAGEDYAMSTALVFNVTITAGSTSSSFSVDIINDMIQEDNETFNITIRLLPSCLSLTFGTSSSTVAIIDNDEVVIEFQSTTFSGTETSGVISVTVVISGRIISSRDIRVPVSFTPLTAVGNNIDFNSTTQTAIIAAGTNSSTVNITVVNDDIVEGDELFNMTLNVPTLPGVIAGPITMATGVINDSTMITVRFTQNLFTGSEIKGFVMVNIELVSGTSASLFNITVTPLEQTPASAEGGVDFNTITLTATFASRMTMSSVTVQVINDSLSEGSEEFNLVLDVPSSLGPAITAGGRNTAVGVITDSTVLVVQFTSGQFSGSESSGFIEVVVRITGGTSGNPITVTVTPSVQSPVSAMGSSIDFNSNPFNITINAGATEGRANISVTCDDEVEGSETFDMTLTLTSSTSGVTLGRDTCEGVINDSTVEVSFSHSSYEVMEDDGTVSLMITLSQVSSVPLELMVDVMEAGVDGEEYNGSSIRLVDIPAGEMTQPFTVVISDNDILECDETLIVTILSAISCRVAIGNTNRSEVRIIDDDSAMVSLSQSQYSVAESDTLLTVNITLSSTASEDVMLEVNISDGSAIAKEDYGLSTALVFNVTITAGSTSSSFEIDIFNDTIQEDNETFNITIKLLPSCLSLSLGTSSSTVTIIDNDGLLVEFSNSTYSGTESSGVIVVSLNLLGGTTNESLYVNVLTSSGTAIGGVDYDNATLTAVFTADSTVATVEIAIINDTVVEENEKFNITLILLPTNSTRVTLGVHSTATAVIIDTTPPQIYVHPMSMVVEVNNDSTSVQFTCMAYGASSYSWERENGSIPLSAEGANSSRLLLHNILPTDNGRYRCVAENKHSKSYSNYSTLIVKVLPPVVNVMPTEITVKEGEHASFNCSATGAGVKDFKYQWLFNTYPPRTIDEDTSILVINSVSENEIGSYTCEATNSLGGSGQSGMAKLYLDDYCNPVKVEYTGFSITWNATKTGITVEAPCTGPGLKGIVHRKCIMADMWQENITCLREDSGTTLLLDQANNLTSLNETERIAEINIIANVLANITAPTQDPINSTDIDMAVSIIATLNNATGTIITNLDSDDAFFEDTARVMDNLLNRANRDSWEQLENDSSVSQNLLRGAEQLTELLGKTLSNDTTKATKTMENIVIKAERISDDNTNEGYMFPDDEDEDDLADYDGGIVQLMISSGLLQDINSTELTVAVTLIRNDTGLSLSSSNLETAVLASSIFSLQMDPPPTSNALEKNPIAMTFDVDLPATALSEQRRNDFTCNFYDYTLNMDNSNQIGGWSTVGLTLDKSRPDEMSATCLTTHLTSFGVLSSTEDARPGSTDDDESLSIILYIGCAVSLAFLCLCILILLFVIFKTKEKINYLFIHLNLCISLALGLVAFIVGIEEATENDDGCTIVAVLLHYLLTSAFCWMLCEAVFLYMMLVTVCGNRLNKLLFFFILGWGPAIPIVAVSAGLGHEHYGTDDYCWIDSDDGVFFAFIGPIAAIILITFVFLAITMKVLCLNKRKVMRQNVESNKQTAKGLLTAAIVLLPVLGVTWIIGILAVNDNDNEVFRWIFAISNCLQGIFIFIFYVLGNRLVRMEVKMCCKCTESNKDITGTPKGKPSLDTNNESKKMSTGVDYLSPTLEKSFMNKSEGLEDSGGEDSDQIKLSTFRRREEVIMERYDAEGGNSVEDKPDGNEEEKKSITEEAVTAVKVPPPVAAKPTPFPRNAK